MPTALTIYGSANPAATVTTAGDIWTATGGTSANIATKIGKSTQYVEVFGRGTTTTQTGQASIPAPTGNGWLLDTTTLEGQTVLAGTWTPTFTMLSSASTVTGTLTVRWYKRSSAGVYNAIGTVTSNSIGLTTAAVQLTFASPPSLAAASFATGDKLYIDAWFNITTNGPNATTTTISVQEANSTSTAGVAGQAQTVTPGYQTTGLPAPVLVGSNSGTTQVTSGSITTTAAIPVGAMALVAVHRGNVNAVSDITSITDSAGGNTWARVTGAGDAGQNEYVSLWYCARVATSIASGGTITANGLNLLASGPSWALTAYYVTGMAASPLDGTASAITTNTNPWATGNVTTTNANDLLFGLAGWNQDAPVTIGSSASNPTSGWAAPTQVAAGNGNGLAVAWQSVAATGAYHLNGTLTVGNALGAVLGAFKQAPPPTTNNPANAGAKIALSATTTITGGATLALNTGRAFEDAVEARNPAAYWRMQDASGNLTDRTGHGHTLTAHGTPTYAQATLLSNDAADKSVVVHRASATDYFDASAQTGLPAMASNWTLLALVNLTEFGAYRTIIGFGANATGQWGNISCDATGVYGEVAGISSTTSVAFTTGSRHLFLAKWDNTAQQAYFSLDGGAFVAAGYGAAATNPASYGIVLGGTWGGGNWCDGTFDEAAIFPSALSDADASALYTAMGSSGTTGNPAIAGARLALQASGNAASAGAKVALTQAGLGVAAGATLALGGRYANPGPLTPIISVGQPVYGPANGYNANYITDRSYSTHGLWRSVDVPSVASPVVIDIDLSAVASGNRQSVVLRWNNNSGDYFNSGSYSSLASDYTIQVNSAAGGGASPSTGWVTLITVSGNTYNSRAHKFNFAGYNWVRMRVTAALGASPNNDVQLVLDIFNNSDKRDEDEWLFTGDSITREALSVWNINGSAWDTGYGPLETLIATATSNAYTPIVMDGGWGGMTIGWMDTNFASETGAFSGHYLPICFGTNDVNVGFAWTQTNIDSWYASLLSVIDKTLAKGWVPIVPHIPWGSANSGFLGSNAKLVNDYLDAHLTTDRPLAMLGPDLWAPFNNNHALIDTDGIHPTYQGSVPNGLEVWQTTWRDWMTANIYGGLTTTAGHQDAGATVCIGAVGGGTQQAGATLAVQRLSNPAAAGALLALKTSSNTRSAGAQVALRSVATTAAAGARVSLAALGNGTQARAKLALVGTSTAVAAGATIALDSTALAGWSLLWNDEFDDGVIDTTKWGVQDALAGGYDDGYHHDANGDTTWSVHYKTSNVVESGSLLHLYTKHETYGDKAYTSGSVGTYSKQQIGPPTAGTPLLIRIKAKLSATCKSNWPGLWLWQEYSAANRNNAYEFDLMESGNDPHVVSTYVHDWAGSGGSQVYATNTVDYSADFHLYELEWDTTYQTIRIDGVQLANLTGHFYNYYANLALNGNLDNNQWPSLTGGAPDATTAAALDAAPLDMQIDYVRVYQKSTSGGTGLNATAGARIALAGPSSAYDSAVLARNPVVFWKLGEATGTFADSSSNGNTGSILNSGTAYSLARAQTGLIPSESDGAVTNPGNLAASERVGLASGTGIPSGNAAWTVTGVAKINAARTANTYLMGIGGWGTNNTAGAIQVNATGPFADVYGTGTTAYAASNGTTYHLAARYTPNGTNPGTLDLFVNGVKQSTASVGPLNLPSPSAVAVLNDPNGWTNACPATVDGFAVFASALLDADISALATASTATTRQTAAGATVALTGGLTTTVQAGARLALTQPGLTRSAGSRLALKTVGNGRAAGASLSLKTVQAVAAGTRLALSGNSTRQGTATLALVGTNGRDAGARLALRLAGATQQAGARFALAALGNTKSAGATINLSVSTPRVYAPPQQLVNASMADVGPLATSSLLANVGPAALTQTLVDAGPLAMGSNLIDLQALVGGTSSATLVDAGPLSLTSMLQDNGPLALTSSFRLS